MSEPLKPCRPWREVAQELAYEQDPRRITELSEELNRALEEQGFDNGKKKSA